MEALLSSQGSLWELFSQAIKSAELGPTYCLIDGLDECKDESARWLAAQFATLAQRSQNTSLHLLVVSRAMLDFRSVEQIHLDPDNDHHVRADITTFTAARMSSLQQRLQFSDEFSAHVKLELLKKAGGTFLWIGYAMNELLSKSTRLEVQEALNDLPAQLPALYGRMLGNVGPSKRLTITTMLKWIVAAVRPLTPQELSAAIFEQPPEHMDRTQFAQDYITICEPLISVQRGVVVLVHESARDYLLREREDDHGDDGHFPENIRITNDDAHLSLVDGCLDALENFSGLSGYANDFWAHHLRQCPKTAQTSILEHRAFFANESALRQTWWNLHSEDELTHPHIRGGTCPPPLHKACYLALNVWAQTTVAQQQRTLKSRESIINGATGASLNTPLHFAVTGRHGVDGGHDLAIIRFLLANGADPTLSRKWMEDPILLAISYRHVERAELLLRFLKAQAPLKVQSCKQLSASLIKAVLGNLASIAELCLDVGVSPDQFIISRNGETEATSHLLDIAIDLGNKEILKSLLNHGADLRFDSDQALSSPLLLALRRGRVELAQTLVEYGAFPQGVTSSTRLLWVSIREANVCGVDFAFQHGADPNIVLGGPLGGFTCLHWAIIEWRRREYSGSTCTAYTSIARRLLGRGANPELPDRRGKAPMDYAVAERAVLEPFSKLVEQSKATVSGAAIDDCGSPKPDLQLLETGGTKSRLPPNPWRPGLRRKSSDPS